MREEEGVRVGGLMKMQRCRAKIMVRVIDGGAIASLLATVSCFHSPSHPRRQMPPLVSRGPKIYLISSHLIDNGKADDIPYLLNSSFPAGSFSLSDGEDCALCVACSCFSQVPKSTYGQDFPPNI